jgi:hypothetical protein
VSVELTAVRWVVGFGQGHEVVVVARIGEGVSEDEERRDYRWLCASFGCDCRCVIWR